MSGWRVATGATSAKAQGTKALKPKNLAHSTVFSVLEGDKEVALAPAAAKSKGVKAAEHAQKTGRGGAAKQATAHVTKASARAAEQKKAEQLAQKRKKEKDEARYDLCRVVNARYFPNEEDSDRDYLRLIVGSRGEW